MSSDRRAVSVVVPTLREAANIRPLAHRIEAALNAARVDWELLLIDDDSADGSEAIAQSLAEHLPVRMEVRRGATPDLSQAVLHGFRLARFDQLVVMDADLSHAPERIPALLASLDGCCDMVVGSRHAPGGRFDRGWGLYRVLNSWLATLLARPLARCSDPMSGFFAVRRSALPDLATLRPVGFKIGLELMVRGRLRLAEVPIVFADRGRGASKLNWRQQLNYLRHLGRLYLFRFGAATRLICFGLVGASGFVIDLAWYLGLNSLGTEHRLARFLSFWPAVSWNWWLNRRLTFAERPPRPRARQWLDFVASSLVGLSVNVGSYVALTSLVGFFARYQLLALVCGVVLGSAFNFVVANAFVYGARPAASRASSRAP